MQPHPEILRRFTEYTEDHLRTLAVPLGGIGAGSIGLNGYGGLCDFQLQNRPRLDSMNPHTFTALRVSDPTGNVRVRVAEGQMAPPFHRHPRSINGAYFPHNGPGDVFGLPRFRRARFRGAFPFCQCLLEDDDLPVRVELTAYSPMIPMNLEDSTLPLAVLSYRIQSLSDQPLDLSLAMSVRSPLAEAPGKGGLRQHAVRRDGMRGVVYENSNRPEDDPERGQFVIATPHPAGFEREYWHRLAWFGTLQTFWDEFKQTGELTPHTYPDSPPSSQNIATLGLRAALPPGESVELPFWISWCFPRSEYPFGKANAAGQTEEGGIRPRWKTWYTRRFPDAWKVLTYYRENQERIRAGSCAFRASLEAGSIDDSVLDAVSSNLAILHSPSLLLFEDGTPYGFEGCNPAGGCCPGSCTHVWNYATAPGMLYPELMKRMTEAHYRHNMSPSGSGGMAFRIRVPLREQEEVPNPAVDGQLGLFLHAFQLWKRGGDTEWLRRIWPAMRDSLEYCWTYWDHNKDGVIEGIQHNTYDISFYGPNPLANGYYLSALRAGAILARHLGETERAADYEACARKTSDWFETSAFNGDYYEQTVDPSAWQYAETPQHPPVREIPSMVEGEPKWQHGAGCLSDQLTGVWLGQFAGIPSALNPDQHADTLRAIFHNNFRTEMNSHENCQRSFALYDESGLILCSWPRGGRPALPFIYCDEVWTGVEYTVAAQLMEAGMEEESLTLVRAARDRYNGEKRNPFCEFECGAYYVRALASWGLLTAASGFDWDAISGKLSMRIPQSEGAFFFTAGTAWGLLAREREEIRIDLNFGELEVNEVNINGSTCQGDYPMRLHAGDRARLRTAHVEPEH